MPSKTNVQRLNLVLVVAASTVPTMLWALPIEQIPNPRMINGNWVSDVANILKPETEQKLNTLINQLQAVNGSEIAVVTVPDSAPSSTPKELATTLFNSWGIGQKGKDNGVIFLISVGDRRVEIETGYGLEAALPDAKVGRIIEERITPAFKGKDFDAGALSGTEALAQLLQGENIDSGSVSWPFNLQKNWLGLAIFGGGLIFIFGLWMISFFPDLSSNLVASTKGLAVLVLLRGLSGAIREVASPPFLPREGLALDM